MFKTSKYLQKLVNKIPLAGEIYSIAVKGDEEIYACTDNGLMRFNGAEWHTLNGEVIFNKICVFDGGKVIASAGKELFEITNEGANVLFTFPEDICDFCYNEKIIVATRNGYYLPCEDGFYKDHTHPIEQEHNGLCAKDEKVCLINSRCIQRLEGKRKTWRCIFHDHSTMPDIKINCACFDALGNLLLGTDTGLFIYDYKSTWLSKKEIPVLPEEKIYAIDVLDDGGIFLGTEAGACLIKNGIAKYLPAEKFAFNTHVNCVASCGDSLYTASKGGIVKIAFKEMTLLDKAEHILDETEKYFPRKEGFITWLNGKKGEVVSSISDNDGLWTQTYLCALCMAYDVTKNEKYRKMAKRYKDAMLILSKATEIKGFPARAVRYPDEPGWGEGLGELDLGSEWHRSSDGTYEWLGETSSDEMTGHYVGYSLYYDLCATEEEKPALREAICDMTDHILEHNGFLCDFDGLPTSWACWNPDALNNDSMWMWEKGVNSLEILNFLKITYHVSGDEKYNEKYMSLINDHHFLLNAAYHKRADGHTCHIDDNLAMMNSLSYLRLEENPAIRQYILMGLAHHYNYEKVEKNPYFGFIYSAFTGEPCDVDECVKSLHAFHYEVEGYVMDNDNRKGIEYDDESVYWGADPRIKDPLAWDEMPFSRLGLDPFHISGGDADYIECGSTYLFIYWLGRFLGIIE